ncbi:glycosyltransferase [Cytophagaceae bacterium YF14B1]|uniref:Glycosyltransferase n=1 Tax=Xanthocytophaga flava TaxID=3048013 RepID=A0AAE3QW30_9BACT|nr:glycosyltransferase [Xanthocytophaga flavus]MDJ1484360.1 glycosyltransferase [Xanthocytophaga flavus]
MSSDTIYTITPATPTSVLYLSYDGLTDPLGQSQVLPYIMGLAKRGYQFTIISTEKTEAYEKRKDIIKGLIEPFGKNIDWQPIFYTKKPPVVSTLWDVRKIQSKAVELHKKKHFQIVHCRSYITALVGAFLKKKFQIPFIFDMRGFWADERIEGGIWNLKNPLFKSVYQFFKKKEKQFLQLADHTISLTFNAKQEIHSWPGFSTVPIQVIPCCVDTQLFQRNNDLSESKELTISYLGSLGTWYMLDEMLHFFKRVLVHYPHARFLFITPDDPEMIRRNAQKYGISGDTIRIMKAERKEVPIRLAESHISLFFIKPSFSKKASSPTKMGEILSMGIPVICNANVGDANYLMENYSSGELVRTFTEVEYDRVISQLDEIRMISSESLRQTALDYFDLEKGIGLYEEVYQKLSTTNV